MLQKIKQLIKLNKTLLQNKPVNIFFTYNGTKTFEELLQTLNSYFLNHPAKKEIYKKELDFLNTPFAPTNNIDKILFSIIPYPFVFNYNYQDIEVFRDEDAGMFYVYLDDKKLYYHKGFTNITDIQKSFTFLCIEQHPNSPHRYLDDHFFVNTDDVMADIGAAEGNFSLLIVDKVKELIIVEAEEIWMEALRNTFEPWKDKVTIINKCVGDTNNENTITLDKVKSQNKITAIKMDIEGAEVSVLQSADLYLKENNIKMAATTYHKQTDAIDIKNILEKNNYNTVFSNGYMLFIYDKLTPPYFRNGLIKAKK
jgi:hypothetical protein